MEKSIHSIREGKRIKVSSRNFISWMNHLTQLWIFVCWLGTDIFSLVLYLGEIFFPITHYLKSKCHFCLNSAYKCKDNFLKACINLTKYVTYPCQLGLKVSRVVSGMWGFCSPVLVPCDKMKQFPKIMILSCFIIPDISWTLFPSLLIPVPYNTTEILKHIDLKAVWWG